MIEMWDELFSKLNPKTAESLLELNGNQAFKLMHQELDKTWQECHRVLSPGGIACINIGDATRKLGDRFRLYSNHSRITESFHHLGFDNLPLILWRKQTNAPNKFMGSGMLPSGAYVTLEHEYILIFRKGPKRDFTRESDKSTRQESAFFWEERNAWFSDIWDFKGVKQRIATDKTRHRSAAYPFELAYRLINMYSVKGDLVLDPFLGTGTTVIAAIASNRNSIGIEMDANLKDLINTNILSSGDSIKSYTKERYNRHISFVRDYEATKGKLNYINNYHGFPVMTSQERSLKLDILDSIKNGSDGNLLADYSENNFPSTG